MAWRYDYTSMQIIEPQADGLTVIATIPSSQIIGGEQVYRTAYEAGKFGYVLAAAPRLRDALRALYDEYLWDSDNPGRAKVWDDARAALAIAEL